jgi:hypothetical protein
VWLVGLASWYKSLLRHCNCKFSNRDGNVWLNCNRVRRFYTLFVHNYTHVFGIKAFFVVKSCFKS